MHAGRINPPVVEVEERTYGDCEIESLVRPSRSAHVIQIRRHDSRRIVIDLVEKAEERFVPIVERRSLEVGQHALDQRFVAEKFRRNCGVGVDSKRAVIALGGVCRNQLAQTGTERRRTAQDFLREPGQMSGCRREIGEQMPDLRVLETLAPHRLNEIEVGSGLRVSFDIRQEHWIHQSTIARRRGRGQGPGWLAVCWIRNWPATAGTKWERRVATTIGKFSLWSTVTLLLIVLVAVIWVLAR